MLWDDYVNALVARLKEPEMRGAKRLLVDVPYVVSEDVDDVLLGALNQTLREVAKQDRMAIGKEALKTLTGGAALGGATNVNYINFPKECVQLAGATVDGAPSVLASIANFYQWLKVPQRGTNRYTIWGGRVLFKGAAIALTVVVEPTLDDWKAATTSILPAGYDLRAIDLAVKRILIADNQPAFKS